MSEQTESKQKNHTKHASVAPELEGTLNVYTAQEIKMHGESKSILQWMNLYYTQTHHLDDWNPESGLISSTPLAPYVNN